MSQATRIDWFSFRTPAMRAFHMSWLAFFLCFFGWFGLSPLLPVIREDLGLSREQIETSFMVMMGVTIVARIFIGGICDRFGPRRTYAGLLLLGAIPVTAVSVAEGYWSFLICRGAIGIIGASFTITQYHTSLMFSPRVVGTANATTAGWGNMGGGATQLAMPVIMGGAMLVTGADRDTGWRLAMVIPGVVMMLTAVAYMRLTQDTPEGDFEELRGQGEATHRDLYPGSYLQAALDYRVWALFVIYGACFGVALTMNDKAARYFFDDFEMKLGWAGLVAGLFGMMNLFARSLGGWISDRWAARWGHGVRTRWLTLVLVGEGLALMAFSRMTTWQTAVPLLVVFGVLVQMAQGATFAVVPLISRRLLGPNIGLVGGGGNVGALAAGFLFRAADLPWARAFLILGVIVAACAPLALLVRLPEVEDGGES